jgi:hypothetical protein
MQARTDLSNTISAFSIVIAMLIEELEKSGAVSRKNFAERLRKTALDVERRAPGHLRGVDRLDLQIARHVADLLSAEPGKPRPAWKPIVQGGLSEPKE